MTAEQLQFWADDPPSGEKRNDLVAEEMRVDSPVDSSGNGIFMDDLPNAQGGVRPQPVDSNRNTARRSRGPWIYLPEFASEAVRKQHASVLPPLPCTTRT